MSTVRIRSGLKFEVRAWGDESSCQLIDLLEELEKNSNPDAGAIWRLINEATSSGPSRNKDKCRPLRGNGKGLYEFKARGGSRILWFYDKNRIICTHGFKKGHPLPTEIKTAQAIKRKYFEENKNASQ